MTFNIGIGSKFGKKTHITEIDNIFEAKQFRNLLHNEEMGANTEKQVCVADLLR